MDAPLGLRFKKFLSWILSDWALSASMLVLLYVLNHFAITSPIYFIFLSLIAIEAPTIALIALMCLMGATFVLGVYFPSSYDFVVPDSQNAAQLKFLSMIHFAMVKNPFILMWEQLIIFLAATLFRVHGQLGKSFEALVYLAIPMLFLLYDSDGLYLLAKHFSKITAEKSLLKNGMTVNELLDSGAVFILASNVVWLSFSFWVSVRLSAWIHKAYKLYAPTVSRIRLSPFYPVITAGVIFFDPQWLLVLSIPILISFISLVVFFAESRKFRRQEAVIIALGLIFMIYSIIPELGMFLFLPLIDSFVDLRSQFAKLNGNKA